MNCVNTVEVKNNLLEMYSFGILLNVFLCLLKSAYACLAYEGSEIETRFLRRNI